MMIELPNGEIVQAEDCHFLLDKDNHVSRLRWTQTTRGADEGLFLMHLADDNAIAEGRH